ncbi:PIN domain-containing protein [Zavarzinia sp.]|uniref:PIN domain-containing protein n=1 Tax=Zavarzinia sp. TaxID=2027920 RepID=UPI00356AE53E
MSADFLDSNILAYTASADPAKAARAEALLAAGGTISVQVLNEVAHVARRKMGLSWAETRDFLEALRGLLGPVVPLDLATHAEALALGERYGFSVYDALIVAAALRAGCDRLWTEDMQDGLLVEGRLRIANPFRE